MYTSVSQARITKELIQDTDSLSPSPGDSGLRGLAFCFTISMSNQISNHSYCTLLLRRGEQKGKTLQTHHTWQVLLVCTLVYRLPSAHRACTHAWCAFSISLLLSPMGTITSKAKGKVPRELRRNLVILSDPGSMGTKIRNTSKDFPTYHNHVIVKK